MMSVIYIMILELSFFREMLTYDVVNTTTVRHVKSLKCQIKANCTYSDKFINGRTLCVGQNPSAGTSVPIGSDVYISWLQSRTC